MRHSLRIAVGVLALGGVFYVSAQDESPVEKTREILAKWVQTQELISKERREWQTGKQMLEQRISLLQGEIKSTRDKISETGASLGDVRGKRGELAMQKRTLLDATTSLDIAIGGLEAKTKSLVGMLPDPIRNKIDLLAARLPANPARTNMSLAERYQNVIGILNEVNKFNQGIHLFSEVRPLPDGTRAEVQTVYLGLGQAYFVTPNGETAAVGTPTNDGWTWEAADALAPQVTETIKILNSEAVPAYVPLPVTIR